jgi:molybdate transport system substrate-binding protein
MPRQTLVLETLATLLILGVIAGIGVWQLRKDRPESPLVVYCAAALKPAMQIIVADYERDTGRPVELRFGNSEQILAQATLAGDADLLLPADDSYVKKVQTAGTATESFPLARMRVVVLTQAGNPKGIAGFSDLLKKDVRLGQANPDAAAIGKVTRDQLERANLWQPLHANTLVYQTTVTDAANAVKLGACDAAIVWDAVAANYPSLTVVKLPELDGAVGRVEIALLKSSPDPEAARRLVQFIHSDRGQAAFRTAGFTDLVAP